MMAFLVLLLVCPVCIYAKGNSRVRVRSMKWYSTRSYFLDLTQGNPRGISVKQALKDGRPSGAVDAINGSFFGRLPNGNIYPIGIVIQHGENYSLCGAPARRGYLWFDTKPHITRNMPPKNAIVAISGGPILIYEGKPVDQFLGNFKNDVIGPDCDLRSIFAIKGDKFYLIRIEGNLESIKLYLEKWGFDYAINLDGGESSKKTRKVANVLVVYPKTRNVYRQYAAKNFREE